ncbi:MAG TPA: hypothetical protein VJL29_00885 [Thermoguttaceae bacterium]|nr:hypothetical protein [Thermoguttaceae bacterium]
MMRQWNRRDFARGISRERGRNRAMVRRSADRRHVDYGFGGGDYLHFSDSHALFMVRVTERIMAETILRNPASMKD